MSTGRVTLSATISYRPMWRRCAGRHIRAPLMLTCPLHAQGPPLRQATRKVTIELAEPPRQYALPHRRLRVDVRLKPPALSPIKGWRQLEDAAAVVAVTAALQLGLGRILSSCCRFLHPRATERAPGGSVVPPVSDRYGTGRRRTREGSRRRRSRRCRPA